MSDAVGSAPDQAGSALQPNKVVQPLKIDLSDIKKQADLKAASADLEIIRKRRLAFSESFGAAAWLLSHDAVYSGMSLRALEAAIGAPMRAGQYKIYRKQGTPFAYASWAYLNEEVEARVVSGGAGLKPDEWGSGEQLWLVDLIAPFGGVDLVKTDLKEKIFKDRNFQILSVRRQESFAELGPGEEAAESLFQDIGQTEPSADIRIVRADEALRKRYVHLAVPFIKLFLASGAFKGIGLDGAKIRRIVSQLIERPDAVLLVALHRGIPCGGFAGELLEFGFGRDCFAQEIAFIVHPRFRGKGVGARLLGEFEAWAKQRDAVWLQYIQASELAPEAAEAVYIRSGARRAGYVYRKPLRGDQ